MINSTAAALLATALDSDPELAIDMLRVIANAGRVLQPSLLPGLLSRATAARAIRPALWAVAGERGRWLAAQNPAWQGLLRDAGPSPAELSDETWQFGSESARQTWLKELRRADPGRALDLLAQGWTSEPPAARAGLLAGLETSLSMDDEPLLERALDDRRSDVGEQAVRLLQRLPGSRWSRRMVARATSLVRLEDGGLVIDPPTSIDAAGVRDGIRTNPPKGSSERAYWLLVILSNTPLDWWTEQLGLSAAKIIEAAATATFGAELLQALHLATVRQGSVGWARELLSSRFDLQLPAALIELLPGHERDRFAISRLDSPEVLQACPGPWSIQLSDAVINWIVTRTLIEARRVPHAALGAVLDLAGRRLPSDEQPVDYLARIADIDAQLPQTSTVHPRLRRSYETVLLRRRLSEELR